MSVTDTERLEEGAARQAQERYFALFERSLDCVFLLDLEGRFIDANPAALALLGYTREMISSTSLASLLDPGQMPLAERRMKELKATGRNEKIAEYKLRRRDGEHVVVESKGSIVLHEGRPLAILGVARDITERKRIEAALQESEGKFRSLVENMHAAVGIVQGTRFVYANQYMAQMLGYSVDEILSMDFPQLVHPAHREKMIDWARRRQLGEPAPGNYEFLAMTKAGECRWVDFSPARIVYRGRPAIIGTGFDVTRHRQIEATLRQSEERLRLMSETATRLLVAERAQEALPEVFSAVADHLRAEVYLNYLVTADGQRLRLHSCRGLEEAAAGKMEFIEFGQPFCGIVARERKRITINRVGTCGRPGADLLRGLGIRAYACQPLLDGGVMGTISFCTRNRDSFSDEELDLMRAVADQVSMALLRQRLTEELTQRAAALDQANRAKDHFLAVLSHELRTPLTAVLPALGALEKSVPEELREYVDMARRNVEMEARLIDDLLDVTRIERGKVELDRRPVEVCAILQRAAEVCSADIEARQLHFSITCEREHCVVHADAARLQQVFWNLVKNAIKFTPHGGCVGIRCQRRGDQAVVTVTDSGEGIDSEALGRIFHAFEQAERSTTRQFGGLGLGLTISKALVELHGGSIEARSEGKGRGATFTVSMPLLVGAGHAPPNSAGARHASPEQTERAGHAPPLRILLVEDHGDTARILSKLLRAEGHEVKHAGDVATALELARAERFDVMLSDLGLPDGSGHDLMRQLRQEGQTLSGIALSGYGMTADVQASRDAGFAEHVTKPVNFDVLLAALGRVVPGTAVQPRRGSGDSITT